jgi:hypothetical protein
LLIIIVWYIAPKEKYRKAAMCRKKTIFKTAFVYEYFFT